MRTILLAAVTVATMLSSTTTAEAAIRLKATKCPVAADAAFRIIGARGERDGVAAEYEWLRQERPGWRRDAQALIEDGRKQYDLLMISKGRKKQVICFDITGFFGKLR